MHQYPVQSEDVVTQCGQAGYFVAQETNLEFYAYTDISLVANVARFWPYELLASTEEHFKKVQVYTIHMGKPQLFNKNEGRY